MGKDQLIDGSNFVKVKFSGIKILRTNIYLVHMDRLIYKSINILHN